MSIHKVKDLIEILQRLDEMYCIGHMQYSVSNGEINICSSNNDSTILAMLRPNHGQVWVSWDLIKKEKYPESPNRFEESVKEADDDVPF